MIKFAALRDSKPVSGKTFLYVMAADSNFAKVGIAANPTARRQQLQTGNPRSIAIKAVFGPFFKAKKLETAIHKRLKAAASVGEWFEDLEQVMAAVNAELEMFIDGEGAKPTETQVVDEMRFLFGPSFDKSVFGMAMTGDLVQPSLLN